MKCLVKVITPLLGDFPFLLHYNLELQWTFLGFVTYDVHNMPMTLKGQFVIVTQTIIKIKKIGILSMQLSIVVCIQHHPTPFPPKVNTVQGCQSPKVKFTHTT